MFLFFGVLDGIHFDFLPIPGDDVDIAVDVFQMDPALPGQRVGLMKFFAHFLSSGSLEAPKTVASESTVNVLQKRIDFILTSVG